MRGAWPLVGRSEELERIKEVLFRSEGAGVVLVGGTGVGKTRLAKEALALARRKDFSTVWGAATEAGRSVPFGALAHLLPPALSGAPSRWDIIRAAETALVERAGGRRVVLGIDDAHLLDEHSAVLVHHLAQTEAATVVASVKIGTRSADPVTALWKDEVCERLELRDLEKPEVEELLESVLGSPLEEATLHRLFEATRGNPLYLRELVRSGDESGALVEAGGHWRWTGPLSSSPRLRELVASRIGRPSREEREVLEVVAHGEPVEMRVLETLVTGTAVAPLEEAGLITEGREDRRLFVGLAHPLYAEAIRAATPSAESRAIIARLARALESTGARRWEDLLRLAAWRLDAGLTERIDVLLPAAEQALGIWDFVLAARLARAAALAGGGPHAMLLLAQALVGQGRFDEAEELLAGLEAETGAEPERAQVAEVRAHNLAWNLGQAETAQRVLADAATAAGDPGARDALVAQRAYFLVGMGRGEQGIQEGRALLQRSGLSDKAVFYAVGAGGQGLIWGGRPDEAVETYNRRVDVMRRVLKATPYAPVGETVYLATAAMMAGRLHDAAARAERAYGEALGCDAEWVTAFLAGLTGMVARLQGRAGTAARRLQAGVVPLRDADVFGQRWLLSAELAHALALLGDVERAEEAVREAEVSGGSGRLGAFLTVFLVSARVWTAAARGEVTRAVGIALEGEAALAGTGNRSCQAILLHDVARLGEPRRVAEPLAQLAESCDGRLIPAMARHARALAGRDGAGLGTLSRDFEDMGAYLLAAEAAAQSSRALGEQERSGAALAAVERATILAARCEGAWTPALSEMETPSSLTRREQEVARLAAQGLSNQDIARRLMVSPRTVGNHLHHVYAKLKVAGRKELQGAVGAPFGDDRP